MSEPYTQVSPQFNADSAYVFIEKQVAFGSRVPGTKAHELCGDYLVTKLQEFGAEVIEQNADVTHYNGQNFTLRNMVVMIMCNQNSHYSRDIHTILSQSFFYNTRTNSRIN
jgi:hypothetical protein